MSIRTLSCSNFFCYASFSFSICCAVSFFFFFIFLPHFGSCASPMSRDSAELPGPLVLWIMELGWMAVACGQCALAPLQDPDLWAGNPGLFACVGEKGPCLDSSPSVMGPCGKPVASTSPTGCHISYRLCVWTGPHSFLDTFLTTTVPTLSTLVAPWWT